MFVWFLNEDIEIYFYHPCHNLCYIFLFVIAMLNPHSPSFNVQVFIFDLMSFPQFFNCHLLFFRYPLVLSKTSFQCFLNLHLMWKPCGCIWYSPSVICLISLSCIVPSFVPLPINSFPWIWLPRKFYVSCIPVLSRYDWIV